MVRCVFSVAQTFDLNVVVANKKERKNKRGDEKKKRPRARPAKQDAGVFAGVRTAYRRTFPLFQKKQYPTTTTTKNNNNHHHHRVILLFLRLCLKIYTMATAQQLPYAIDVSPDSTLQFTITNDPPTSEGADGASRCVMTLRHPGLTKQHLAFKVRKLCSRFEG